MIGGSGKINKETTTRYIFPNQKRKGKKRASREKSAKRNYETLVRLREQYTNAVCTKGSQHHQLRL